MRSSPLRLLSAILLAALLAPSLVGAQSFTCGSSDTTLGAPAVELFYPFRPGTKNVHLIWRDTEFMWDGLYAGGLTDNVKLTLASLAHNLVNVTSNPFGAPYGDVELIYQYFRRDVLAPTYNTDPRDTVAMRIGSNTNAAGHIGSDRSHLDCYIFHNTRSTGYDGTYNPAFTTADEDVTSDRPVGDVKHANAFAMRGPSEAEMIDLGGTGWTAPDRGFNVGLMHEFQHGLPPDVGERFATEMISAVSEAVGGSNGSTTFNYDVAYTWPLPAIRLDEPSPCGLPSDDCVRSMDSNYQGRTLFGAYLAHNFRGADTSPTLAAMEDDLAWKWVRTPSRNLFDLRSLLGDADCLTCAGKNYFHPGGVGLDNGSRLALLHHNYRVANYVNNSSLDEGQYGYPPEFGFSPSQQVGAWRGWDPDLTNDLVAIPPEVTLNATHRTRQMALKRERSYGGNTYPLVLQPYGSEYWVVRSDPAIWTAGQDLVLRVSAEDIHRVRHATICGVSGYSPRRDARLVASVVAYSPPADSVAGAPLWAHPEWAARALPPQLIDVDSMAAPLEFVVPSFGDSFKAVVVVISLADGPAMRYSTGGLADYTEAIHYRVDLGVRRAPFQQPNPQTVAASTSIKEDFPSWSPSGVEVAYGAVSASVQTIRRNNLSSGSDQTLTTGREPDWSPRGDLIAFVKDSSDVAECVWIYDTLTTQVRQVTLGSNTTVSPTFSPNGQRIAYARYVQDLPPEAQYPQCTTCGWEVRRVDVNGLNDTRLAQLYGEFEVRSVRWSPDGRWIYLKKRPTAPSGQQGPDQLWIIAADGTQTFVRSGVLDDASTFDLHRGSGPLLLEQVAGVTWLSTCGIGAGNDTTWNVMPVRRIALRDTVASDTSGHFYRTGAEFHNPRWSPDGTRIAYSSNQNLGGDLDFRDLFVGQVSFNHAPTLLGLGDFVVHPGRPFDLQINASDLDNETLTYKSPSVFLPAGSSFTESTRRFYWPNPGPVCSENYVVFRTLDGSGGVASKVIKFTAAIDSVDDLNAEMVTDNQAWLTWTAPGDNGPLGRGVEYQICYAQVPLHEGNFGVGAIVTNVAAPGVPGAAESKMVSDLSAGTTYYFAMRTKDMKDNWSLISNVLQLTTTSGGAGGEFSAQQVRAPLTGLRTAQTAVSRPGGAGDPMAVLAVEMGLNRGAPIWSTRQLSADEITALATGDTTGVLIQARSESGAWTDRLRVSSSDAGWRFAVRALRQPGRIVFIGTYGVRQAWNSVELDGRCGAARLVSAQHSRLGDVKGSFDARGTASLDVAAADSLSMVYEVVTQDSESSQDWYLLVGPPGSEVSTPYKAGSRAASEQLPLPTAFRLKQNQPNPFSGRTSIHFDLPAETHVRLEVFDAQGRLVRSLADGGYPAGFHAAEWDHCSDSGQALGAGVYMYRIQAGSFSEQRKMVLLGR